MENFCRAGGRAKMTIWRMRAACWIPKATDTHSQYVIFIAFLLQKYLQQSPSILSPTYIASLVSFMSSQVLPHTLFDYTSASSAELNLNKTNNNHVEVTYKSITRVPNLKG